MIDYVVAAWLVFVAGYTAWGPPSSDTVGWSFWVLVFLAVAIGLIFRMRWARFGVIAIALLDIVNWAVFSLQAVRGAWPYDDALSTVVSLVPGLVWVAIWTAIAFKMYKGLKRPA